MELGGALGDLGALLPLTAALISLNHMNATGVFFVIGLAYMAAGLFYRLPVPVQPLKAVAAIAIAGGLSASVISASGLVMAAFLLLLAGTGVIGWVARLFPRAIIRGIQLGVGLLLVKAGLALVNRRQPIAGVEESFSLANLSIPTNWLLALALGGFLLLFLRSRKLPAFLAVLSLGGLASILWGSAAGLRSLHLGLSLPGVAMPSLGDLSATLTLLVIPQIPLTLGKRVTPRALLTTMGVANLGAGLLGGIPICHGSGGLTAHFRLGARTGGASLMIGALFLALALFLNGNVFPILALIPYPVLGVLVAFVGVQHSLLVRELRGRGQISVALVVAILGLVTTNLAIGLASGMCLYFILRALAGSRRISLPTYRSKEDGLVTSEEANDTLPGERVPDARGFGH